MELCEGKILIDYILLHSTAPFLHSMNARQPAMQFLKFFFFKVPLLTEYFE